MYMYKYYNSICTQHRFHFDRTLYRKHADKRMCAMAEGWGSVIQQNWNCCIQCFHLGPEYWDTCKHFGARIRPHTQGPLVLWPFRTRKELSVKSIMSLLHWVLHSWGWKHVCSVCISRVTCVGGRTWHVMGKQPIMRRHWRIKLNFFYYALLAMVNTSTFMLARAYPLC